MLDKLNFDLSHKNIAIPPKNVYKQKLLDKALHFIRRLRMVVSSLENPDSAYEKREKFGLKAQWKPPYMESLKFFEEDFFKMIKNVKFRSDFAHVDPFQTKLTSKVSELVKTDKFIVKSDKTNNWFHLSKIEYDELMLKSIKEFYKKSDPTILERINEKIEHFGTVYNVSLN